MNVNPVSVIVAINRDHTKREKLYCYELFTKKQLLDWINGWKAEGFYAFEFTQEQIEDTE